MLATVLARVLLRHQLAEVVASAKHKQRLRRFANADHRVLCYIRTHIRGDLPDQVVGKHINIKRHHPTAAHNADTVVAFVSPAGKRGCVYGTGVSPAGDAWVLLTFHNRNDRVALRECRGAVFK